MKKILPVITVIVLLLQCKPSDLHDLSGGNSLKGVVVLYDTLKGLTTASLYKNAKVFLGYTGSSGFLYSIVANEQGQYTFAGIESNQNYSIYSSSDTGLIKYKGNLPYAANSFSNGQSDTLKLYPSSDNQNVLHLIIQDSTGNRMANVTAWIFNSPVLFAADTSAGRMFDMKSNDYGVDNKINVSADKYYARVKVRIGNIDLTGEDSVEVPQFGIRNLIVTLRTKPLPGRNGMELLLNDIFETPVHNATVHYYRSKNVWMLDTAHVNSIGSMNSNASGLATAYNLDSARYYLRMLKVISKTDTLRRLDSIDVGRFTIAKDTFILLK